MKLFCDQAIELVRTNQAEWERNELAASLKIRPEEQSDYRTDCGIPLKRV
jgi:methylmalonyl-CoA mutase N-terminal domain/subunit